MKSSRTSLVIAYNTRVEVESGVWENELVEKKVRAEQETIYQSRRDRLFLDKQLVTARFRVRSNLITQQLDYATYKGDRYKIHSVNEETDSHFSIIELGDIL